MLYELEYIAAWKEGLREGIEEVIEKKTAEMKEIGIEIGIKEGISLMRKLCIILIENDRLEDVYKIVKDVEYSKKLMKEYDLISNELYKSI